MAILKNVGLKASTIDEITANFDGAQGVVVVNYSGLTVEQDTQLRKSFREAGVTYKVYKNTLIKRAVAGTEFEAVTGLLDGPTAIAVSKEDATAPARIVDGFLKDMPALQFKGGVVGGEFYDEKMIQVIAKIPSREVLIGKLLGSIQSPIANFARVINQIAESKEA